MLSRHHGNTVKVHVSIKLWKPEILGMEQYFSKYTVFLRSISSECSKPTVLSL